MGTILQAMMGLGSILQKFLPLSIVIVFIMSWLALFSFRRRPNTIKTLIVNTLLAILFTLLVVTTALVILAMLIDGFAS